MSVHETIPYSRRKAAERADAETRAWVAAGNQIRRCAPGESAEEPLKANSYQRTVPAPKIKPGSQIDVIYTAMLLRGDWVSTLDLIHVCADLNRVSNTINRLRKRGLVTAGEVKRCSDGKRRMHYKAHKQRS